MGAPEAPVLQRRWAAGVLRQSPYARSALSRASDRRAETTGRPPTSASSAGVRGAMVNTIEPRVRRGQQSQAYGRYPCPRSGSGCPSPRHGRTDRDRVQHVAAANDDAARTQLGQRALAGQIRRASERCLSPPRRRRAAPLQSPARRCRSRRRAIRAPRRSSGSQDNSFARISVAARAHRRADAADRRIGRQSFPCLDRRAVEIGFQLLLAAMYVALDISRTPKIRTGRDPSWVGLRSARSRATTGRRATCIRSGPPRFPASGPSRTACISSGGCA